MLTGDNFMPDISLRQPRLKHSVCGPFTQKKKNQVYKKLKRHETSGIKEWARQGLFST